MIYSRLRAMWTICCLYLKREIAVDSFFIFCVIVQPVLVALLAIFMLRDTEGFQAMYVVVGSALTGLWTGTVYLGSFTVSSERWAGTLEEIIGSPTPLATISMAKTLANAVMSLSSILLSYPLAAFVFGYPLSIARPLLFVVSLLLTLLAMVSLGMVIAPVMSLRLGATVWVSVMEMPIYILAGFLFPIAMLPGWTRPISYVLSPYWAARALHATSTGTAPLSEILLSWGLLVASSVVYWFISAWLFRALLRRATEDATLGLH
jgi:ABC-2 type transport system permease protein